MVTFNTFVLDQLIKQFCHKSHNAFCINEVFYTYAQLGDNVQAIRQSLRENKPNQPEIGLVVNDDMETYASALALWFEGYAYVPLHPSQPLERNLEICGQVGLKIILDSSVKTRYSNFEVINTQTLTPTEFIPEYNKTVDENRLVYILFTSGSTGNPKGVKISRLNLATFVSAFYKSGIHLTENDRCLQCFDMTFDVSVQSYLMPLLSGACVYTVPHNQIKFSYVAGLIEDYNLTFGAMAPSMIRLLKPYFNEIYSKSFKTCIVTAEASPVDLINEFHQRCIPNATIYDCYGPTEATIYCLYYTLPKENIKTHHGIIVIGKPYEGLDMIIINKNNEEVCQGETGEMLVRGNQVTQGYWNNPKADQKAFIDINKNGEKLRYYKTGDLCSIDEDGIVSYQGRIDTQIKINGYRVELGEIEFHARKFYTGSNAVALVSQINDTSKIILYIEHQKENPAKLIEYLRQSLTQYMIPAKVIYLPEFPLNNNGKVDKRELKELI